jgi:hypothetical protein
MHSVKVGRSGISASQLADVIRDELGASYQVKEGPDELKVRKGPFRRATIVLSHESVAPKLRAPDSAAIKEKYRGDGTVLCA